MTGLAFTSLTEWQRWADDRDRAVSALRRLRSARWGPVDDEPSATLWLPDGQPGALIVIDKLTDSCRFAITAPIERLSQPARTALLAPAGAFEGDRFVSERWSPRPWGGTGCLTASITEVLTLGGYLRLAGEVAAWARARDVRHSVIQHGLLTPWSPPPMAGDRLLAWTQEDADFWSEGQSMVTTEVVGSQMLWEAASQPRAVVAADRPLMLGQLHGIELGRRSCLMTYLKFCREVGADYRPHPNERDAVSRVMHKVMRARGITFDDSGVPLTEIARPVVSIFSTGTLEAAHRGLPAWVTHPDPPAWLSQFWARYGLARWGEDPTAAWETSGTEPARRVAEAIEH